MSSITTAEEFVREQIFQAAFKEGYQMGKTFISMWRLSLLPPSCKIKSSVDKQGNETTVSGKGRHDPCVLPRAVPIVESMAALVLADFLLRNKVSKL